MSNPELDPRRMERGHMSELFRSVFRRLNLTLHRSEAKPKPNTGINSSSGNGRRSIAGRMAAQLRRPFEFLRNNRNDKQENGRTNCEQSSAAAPLISQPEENDIADRKSVASPESPVQETFTDPAHVHNASKNHEGIGPDFNPSVYLSGWTDSSLEEVPNLTGRVIKQMALPVFEGTYSNVYKGALDGDTLVAIKALRDQRITTEDARRRFKRETGVSWHLRHPNITPLLGYVIDPDISHYGALVSLWYKNGNAVDYLKAHKDTLTLVHRLDLLCGVAQGIQYLHTRTPIIVHGDLKPRNVLIDDDGVAKICDFGLLRIIHDGAPTGTTTLATHTGTTRYIPYEMMVDGTNPTPSSDIYALGCVGLEFIYDKLPYNHITKEHSRAEYRIGREIEEKQPPAIRPSNLTPTDSGLWDMFERLWDVDATRRPDSTVVCAFLEEHRVAIARELH